ncbi:MAG: cobalamin biosynthesis protein [Acidobacteria bacterium]|nr:cobalamin biosynthesis protein [Acidobacteriota bacterium]
MQPILVLVGGFLGAGKTSLMLAAAARLRASGRRVGLLTNDQAGELVDSALVRAEGFESGEITGGCFCCRFSDFLAAAGEFTQPDVLLAEPVGSCADLAATVIRPLQRLYPERFRIAPLTVLVDPRRAEQLLAAGADPHMSYLFRSQLAEADIVCYTKADLHPVTPPDGRRLSAVTGEGLDEWLHEVLTSTDAVGRRTLDIDYALYADAEAALGWLNLAADFRSRRRLTPAAVAGPLLDSIDQDLTRRELAIAHLKVLVRSASGWVKAGICENGQEPLVDGMLDASPASRHEILLNLRACADPVLLVTVAAVGLAQPDGRVQIRSRAAFRPAPPRPEHRITETV